MAARTRKIQPADHPDRRKVLAGLGAAAIAAPLLPVSSAGAAIAPKRFNVGAIEVSVVSDGTLTVPLSFTLPETPPAEAAAFLAANGYSATGDPVPTNVSLVKTGSEFVLIDAGSGANFQPSAGKLSDNLEAAGIDPAKITKVVFTHAHPDHLWGAIDDLDDLRFPKASYVIAQAEWDFWTSPDTPAKLPDAFKGMALGSARILKRLESKVELRKAGDTVAPGLAYFETAGHTPGHMAVMVESGRELLLIGGDALTHGAISFAKPSWRIGSDYDSDRAIKTRARLLDRLATDRIPLVGFHLPWPGHGRVKRAGNAYRFLPI
jgi:glyoxylase-like metal-dependent hydrolase (beta-lactamase superfamily II)